jgi:hypothetical protein
MLQPEHIALLRESAISSNIASDRVYHSVPDDEKGAMVLERYGFSRAQRNLPGMILPVWGVDGGVRLRQFRSDQPRLNGKGKQVRYETPYGARMALDCHPLIREYLRTPAVPLWITEGIRKADAAISHGLVCVALLGVWNWRGTNEDGGKAALADWESIALNGRRTYVCFDSDVTVKPEVRQALERLRAFLESRGANVKIIGLPAGSNGEKVGLDDYFAAGGSVGELEQLVDQPPGYELTPYDRVVLDGLRGAPAAGDEISLPGSGGQRTSIAVPSIPFMDFHSFAAVDEPGAEPLVGTEDDVLLGVGTDAMVYGDGGAGKSTLVVDLACHAAAGEDWLGFPIERSFTVGIIENEGSRPFFRKKIARRLGGWQGGDIGTRPMVMETPWAGFTFADPSHRYGLAASIAAYELDLVVIGPITTAGMEAAGTLQDVRAFAALTAETRALSKRRVAFALLHHEARHGGVSGAWEGVGDTLIHLQAHGRGQTRLYIQKARNAPGRHKTSLHLRWQEGDAGGFDVEEKEEIPDEAIEDGILAHAAADPGCGARKLDESVSGRGERIRQIRDRLLAEGRIVNRARVDGVDQALDHCPEGKRVHLYLPDHPDVVELPRTLEQQP